MSNNNQQQIDQLKALRDRLQNQETKISQRLAQVREHLNAVTLTISLMGEEPEKEEVPAGIPIRELQGMKQVEALTYIAQRNGGRVRIVDAKKLLIKAGVMKSTKNAYGILYTVINRSGKFNHRGPGEYELSQDSTSEENEVVQIHKRPLAS
jgi:hypothetical protein